MNEINKLHDFKKEKTPVNKLVGFVFDIDIYIDGDFSDSLVHFGYFTKKSEILIVFPKINLKNNTINNDLSTSAMYPDFWFEIPKLQTVITIQQIIDAVSKVLNVDLKSLFSKSKKREIADARHIAMFLMRTELLMGLSDVGRFFYRHHATVLNAERKIKELSQLDSFFYEKLRRVKEELGVE